MGMVSVFSRLKKRCFQIPQNIALSFAILYQLGKVFEKHRSWCVKPSSPSAKTPFLYLSLSLPPLTSLSNYLPLSPPSSPLSSILSPSSLPLLPINRNTFKVHSVAEQLLTLSNVVRQEKETESWGRKLPVWWNNSGDTFEKLLVQTCDCRSQYWIAQFPHG